MALQKWIKFQCVPVKQGKHTLYMISASAKKLWSVVQINARDEDKDEGYQRVLSPSRLRAIATYISKGNPIPTSILVSFVKKGAKLSEDGKYLLVKDAPDSGWVIDGQHRVAGAHQVESEIQLPVVAFLGLDIDEQIEQFVTINREAKGVPTSLYYDLLSHLPKKSPADAAKERAADLATEIKRDEESPFYGRIVVTTSPKKGEMSLNNFVRKIHPLLLDGRALHHYSAPEQAGILMNYYNGLRVAFPSLFVKSSIFFQTIGFGALINALPTALHLCLTQYKGFKVVDVAKMFKEVKHFDFASWEKLGTGSSAEIQAGDDLKQELLSAFNTEGTGTGKTIELG